MAINTAHRQCAGARFVGAVRRLRGAEQLEHQLEIHIFAKRLDMKARQ
jgi:hypothetical protein